MQIQFHTIKKNTPSFASQYDIFVENNWTIDKCVSSCPKGYNTLQHTIFRKCIKINTYSAMKIILLGHLLMAIKAVNTRSENNSPAKI